MLVLANTWYSSTVLLVWRSMRSRHNPFYVKLGKESTDRWFLRQVWKKPYGTGTRKG